MAGILRSSLALLSSTLWIACASPTRDAALTTASGSAPSDAEPSFSSPPRAPRQEMRWVASPYFHAADRTPATVDAIAIHTTESMFRPGSTHAQNQLRAYVGTISYFRNNPRKVSAHFVIGPGGEITQMVREEDAAHTTTYYNNRSFGIECAGWGKRDATWTPELMDSLVQLCADLCLRWQIPASHPEGTAYEGPHSVATDNPKRPRFDAPGIVGHFQVQPWNKSDPGEHFPWPEFMRRLHDRIAAMSTRSSSR